MKTYKQRNKELRQSILKLQDTITELSEYRTVVENEKMFDPSIYFEAVSKLQIARDALNVIAKLELDKRLKQSPELDIFEAWPLKTTTEAIADEALHQSELDNGRIKFT